MPLTRRSLLETAGALAPLAALAACTPKPKRFETVVELASLPEGEHVVVYHQDQPIELVRTGSSVRARSLWCTHTGCRVNWNPERAIYVCTCHQGEFDADGRPITKPPTKPLRTPAFEQRGDRVVIFDEPGQAAVAPASS